MSRSRGGGRRGDVLFEPSTQPLIDESSNSVYGDLYGASASTSSNRFCCGLCRTRVRCVAGVCVVALLALASAGVAAYFWLVPLLAARAVAGVPLVVLGATVTAPTATGFHLALNASLGAVPVGVFVDACTVQLLYGSGDAAAALGTTELPAMTLVAGEASTLTQNATFNITDFALLNVMFDDLLNKPSVQWTLLARTSAVVWGVPFRDIELRKELTLAAFDGFPDRAVDSFGVAGLAANGSGVLVYCASSVVNRSPMSMFFNNAAFELLAGAANVSIGRVHAHALDLVPGNQSLALNGTLYAGADAVKAAAIGDLVSAMLRHDNASNATLTVRGVSATSDDGEPLPWLDALMRSFAISETVPPLVDPQPLRDIVFETVSIQFGDAIVANMTTAVTFYIPPQFAFPFELVQARMEMHMLYNGSIASTLSVPWTSVETVAPQRVRVTATNVSVGYDDALFSALLVDAFNAGNFTIQTSGRAWATIRSAIADELTLSDIPFAAAVPIQGANGFEGGLTLEWIALVSSQPGVASLVGVINVVNNATLSAAPGTFTLGVFVDGVYVGNATAVTPQLPVGVSSHNVTGFLVQTPANLAARQKLMTRYATNRPTPAQLRGSSGGTDVPILKAAFGALHSNTSFPGLNAAKGLLLGVEITIDWFGLSAAGRIQVANPLSVAISVQAANFDVNYNGTLLGTSQHKLTPPVTVPANGTTTTPVLDVQVVLSWSDIVALYSLLCKAETLVNANGTISFALAGGYEESDLPYFQDAIPIALFHLPNNGSAPFPCL